MAKWLRDALISLSLANLCFIGPWRIIVNPAHYSYYTYENYSAFIEVAALILNIFLLAALFWLGVTLARRSGSKYLFLLAQGIFLLVILAILNDERLEFEGLSVGNLVNSLGKGGLAVLCLLGLAVGLFMLARWHRRIVTIAATIVLVLSPFILYTFFNGIFLSAKYRSNAERMGNKQTRPLLPPRPQPSPRVLWIVFDELDARVAFRERPPYVKLPEFDRMRAQAIFATNAYPPYNKTYISMPGLINGKVLTATETTRPDELEIHLTNTKQVTGWSTEPNIFSKAYELGFNTALVGWYNPYCRVIGDSLTSCFWKSSGVWDKSRNATVPGLMKYWAYYSLLRAPLMYRLLETRTRTFEQRMHTEDYQALLDQARKVVVNPDFGMVLVHFPIPHKPYIFNSNKDRISFDENSYTDNLVLADHTLGEVRRLMEQAGMWESTTVLVTADHGWRDLPALARMYPNEEFDRRIPFILKLAGQKEGVVYDPAFVSLISHDLSLGLLRGELSTPEAVVEWLDKHRSEADPVYARHQP